LVGSLGQPIEIDRFPFATNEMGPVFDLYAPHLVGLVPELKIFRSDPRRNRKRAKVSYGGSRKGLT
jgi:hypothetical protein